MKWLCLLFVLSLVATAQEESRPNILFIVLDTLRADHLGCHGYQRATSPNIDKLASEGVRFEKMMATSSWTIPSLMSMFTGLPPSVHGVTKPDRSLNQDILTLASSLRSAGYQTAGFVSNPAASEKLGFARGFDVYEDVTDVTLQAALTPGLDLERSAHRKVSSENLTAAAQKWLREKRDPQKPFFLFVLYFDIHADYIPPKPFDTQFSTHTTPAMEMANLHRLLRKLNDAEKAYLISQYDGEIKWVDKNVGSLLSSLRDAELPKKTLTVLTADHGEEFWDHGRMLHGHTLYEELVHVPLIVSWPGKLPEGKKLSGLYSHVALSRTLLDFANVKPPVTMQEMSLRPVLEDPEKGVRNAYAFFETEISGEVLRGIRSETGKIVWNPISGKLECYDLAKDPSEKNDLAKKSPAWQFDMERRLLDYWKHIEVFSDPKDKRVVDERLLEQLRQMGYSQ